MRAPRVGVGALILREGLVLLGERSGSHGAGTWALPGGHLEFGESPHDCAVREVLEETGLIVLGTSPGPWVNTVFEAEGLHYLTALMIAEVGCGEPRIMEPDKCKGWQWHRWSDMPSPLFAPLESLRASGYVPAGLI